VRPVIDAHLDLAWNALQWNRDLTRPLEAMNQSESHMTDHLARGHATVSLPGVPRSWRLRTTPSGAGEPP
jgi:membrane dipeptidase